MHPVKKSENTKANVAAPSTVRKRNFDLPVINEANGPIRGAGPDVFIARGKPGDESCGPFVP